MCMKTLTMPYKKVLPYEKVGYPMKKSATL